MSGLPSSNVPHPPHLTSLNYQHLLHLNPPTTIKMKFITVAAALFGATMASASAQGYNTNGEEVIYLENYTVTLSNAGVVQSVSFKLSGDAGKNLQCSTPQGPPKIPGDTPIECNGGTYRFQLIPNPIPGADTTYPGLELFHETGDASRKSAAVSGPPLACHAGPSSTGVKVSQRHRIFSLARDEKT
ncbi:hypothetical protein J1614_007655 [Plenodomus biglobosus]|nr:hypothetical protein J1614_007655 [Plenodomus biglobosus]